jgi:hypothetical protein
VIVGRDEHRLHVYRKAILGEKVSTSSATNGETSVVTGSDQDGRVAEWEYSGGTGVVPNVQNS